MKKLKAGLSDRDFGLVGVHRDGWWPPLFGVFDTADRIVSGFAVQITYTDNTVFQIVAGNGEMTLQINNIKSYKGDEIMAITGIGSNYSNVYGGTYATKKNEAAKEVAKETETKKATSAQAENTKDAGEKAVSDYYSYLQKNYESMSKGNVTISSEYLKKCAGDSEKAKELENFLKSIPELEKQGYEQLSAQNRGLGGTVTCYQQTWMVNKDGSIQSTVYSVTETGMTNAEKLKKNMEERLEKQKEKKAEEEKAEEKKEEKMEQAEKLDGGTEKISMPEAAVREITVKHVEAKSELEATAMMQKEKLEDAYYPKFDRNV